MGETTIRQQVIAILAGVLRDTPEEKEWEVVSAAMRESGLRRAVWATWNDLQKERVISEAKRLASKEPANG